MYHEPREDPSHNVSPAMPSPDLRERVLRRCRQEMAERVQTELYEIRFLSIGKKAPDIEGDDQDGKHFKLSDYRGKVVLLYFWQEF